MKKDGKKDQIRLASAEVFLNYGFNRVTMEDIAKAANVSRPALYHLYANKTEIYRDVVSGFLDESVAAAAKAGKLEGALAGKLTSIIAASILDVFEKVLSYTHGHELLEVSDSLAEDVVVKWRSDIIALLAKVIPAGKDMTSKELAVHLMDAIDGAKLNKQSIADFRKGVARAIKVTAAVAGK